MGDFEVEIVHNEPAHAVEERIEDLFADARADDVLLVHFSGHGLKGEAGDLYFAARNTRPDRLASTAVPADFVQRCLRSSPSRSIVLLLDCCYGGAFGQGVAVRAAGDVNVLDSFPRDAPAAAAAAPSSPPPAPWSTPSRASGWPTTAARSRHFSRPRSSTGWGPVRRTATRTAGCR